MSFKCWNTFMGENTVSYVLNGALIWWGIKQKNLTRCLEAKRKSKLETTDKILAVRETKLPSKHQRKCWIFSLLMLHNDLMTFCVRAEILDAK